jgi:hypothetical protein
MKLKISADQMEAVLFMLFRKYNFSVAKAQTLARVRPNPCLWQAEAPTYTNLPSPPAYPGNLADMLLLKRYMTRLLIIRNSMIKAFAENGW